MNKYQEKLERIKARRLNWTQRLFSLLASVSLLSAAFFLVPFTLSLIWTLVMTGAIQNHAFIDELGVTGLIITVLATPTICYLVYHCFSWCLKHFVRALSGIKEA